MKTFLQRSILTIVMLLATIVGYAYDFEVDSIYYNKISDTEVEVTYGDTKYSYNGHLTIPDSINFSGLTFKVTKIGNNAFYNNWGIYTVDIPNTVTSIGYSSFESCGNLKSIELPKFLTHIKKHAFSWCQLLTVVEIPKSVRIIEGGVFAYCPKLSNILVDAENEFYCSVDGSVFSKDKTEIIQYATGKDDEAYKIPNTVDRIAYYAFEGAGLISVEIPNSVTIINEGAFFNCPELTSVILPNSALKIGIDAFRKCERMQNIFIPELVSEIGYDVFYQCKNLSSIFVDKNNENYSSKDGILFDKNQTKLIFYPPAKKDVKYIIPESVTSLEGHSFAGNIFIKSLELGKDVDNLEYGALFCGDNLKEIVVLNSTPPNAGDISTSEIYSASTLYVPKESLDDYKNANGWKEFKNIVPIETSGIADAFVDSDVKIESGDGTITVSGAEGGVCRIFDLRGIEVDSRAGISDYESFSVKFPELYIVQVTTNDGKNTIRKVMVK